MAEQSSFVDILRAEIAQHEAALERNPTWIKLQAARRTLAAYEGPEPKKQRASPQPKCGNCRDYYSSHLPAIAPGERRRCPDGSGQIYEPEKKA
jgi:hypothetical protein